MLWRGLAVLSLLVVAPVQGAPKKGSPGAWNEKAIAWKSYAEGMALAAKTHKPVCVVVFATWCPHCTNYARVFNDARIVARAKDFVMIRVDEDQEPEVGKTLAPDGVYVPRTLFIDAAGEVAAGIHAPRPKFKYFYDEADPASLLAGMDEALRKLR